MKILILGGFLGSGKTTLMLKLAEGLIGDSRSENPDSGPSVAILENEIGAVGIDDKIAQDRGYSVKSVLSGCACCTASAELESAVRGIERDLNPDWLVVECSGVALPGQVGDCIAQATGNQSRICVLADSSRWMRIRKPLEMLIEPQVESANLVFLSKADTISPSELAEIEKSVREINATAPMIRVNSLSEDASETIKKSLSALEWNGGEA